MSGLVRALRLALALALAGCAGVPKSTLAPVPRPDYVGGLQAVVLPELRDAEAARLEAAVREALGGQESGVPWQVGRTADGFVRVRLAADDAFEPGTAMLAPRALLVLSALEKPLADSPSAVVHVIGHGADDGGEAATSLSARRAASVQSYLIAEGLPATCVRAEGRGAREPASANPADAWNWRIDLVARPVVAGAEADAWMPPRGGQAIP